jgi:predicted nucleotidyltransferase
VQSSHHLEYDLKRAVNRMAIDLDDVLRRITSIRAGLAIHGVRNLGVFGSVARRDAGPDSDVDMIVDLDPYHQTLDRRHK